MPAHTLPNRALLILARDYFHMPSLPPRKLARRLRAEHRADARQLRYFRTQRHARIYRALMRAYADLPSYA
jgi:hypothetical protein